MQLMSSLEIRDCLNDSVKRVRLSADWCLSPVWLFVLSGGQVGYNGQVPVMGSCGPALLLPADA